MTVEERGAVWIPDLDALLERSGLKSGRVAAQLGVDAALVSLWRHGKRNIPRKYLDQLGGILNTRFVIRGTTAYDIGPGQAAVNIPWDDLLTPEPKPVLPPIAPKPAFVPKREDAPEPPRIHTQPHKGVRIGFDGMPMVPSTAHTYCTCGRRVR